MEHIKCPECNSKMYSRVLFSGIYCGRKVYYCSNYPYCHQIIDVDDYNYDNLKNRLSQHSLIYEIDMSNLDNEKEACEVKNTTTSPEIKKTIKRIGNNNLDINDNSNSKTIKNNEIDRNLSNTIDELVKLEVFPERKCENCFIFRKNGCLGYYKDSLKVCKYHEYGPSNKIHSFLKNLKYN